MKLFAFQPKGHGPYSLFVMAETIEHAVQCVTAHVEKKKAESKYSVVYEYPWNEDYKQEYNVTVAGEGEIIINDNE